MNKKYAFDEKDRLVEVQSQENEQAIARRYDALKSKSNKRDGSSLDIQSPQVANNKGVDYSIETQKRKELLKNVKYLEKNE